MKFITSDNSLKYTAALAGLLYCAWPLGFILNPQVNNGLASNLEASGQPWNWLFIGIDCLCGLLVIWLARRLYLAYVRPSTPKLINYGLIGLGVFGILNIACAVLPLNCVAVGRQCPPILDDPSFIIHGIASIGSVLALSVTLLAFWWLARAGRAVSRIIKKGLNLTIVVWAGFGAGTGLLILFDKSSAFSEHVFIIICSLLIAALPYLTKKLSVR